MCFASLSRPIRPLNFAGLGEMGEDLVRSTYGTNYDRLRELKQKYDPTNQFHQNQNITPATWPGRAGLAGETMRPAVVDHPVPAAVRR